MNESLFNITGNGLFGPDSLVNIIIVAVVIFLVGLILGRVLGKLVERILREFRVDKTVKDKIGVNTSMQKLASGIVSYSIYFVFLIIALNYVGITSLLLNVISIIVIALLAISLLLSVKDSIPNMLAFRRINRSVKIGDKIKINNVEGVVEDMTLFETKLVTKGGDEIHIPNSLFTKETHIKRANRKKRK